MSPVAIQQEKERLSYEVRDLRLEFEAECRRLVTKKEITRAKQNMLIEDQRMVAQGDALWASNRQGSRESINELHQASCRRLGQERPWCYSPSQLVDCPGCGAKIKENILQCPACHGWLDEGIEVLRAQPPKERSVNMYPNRDSEAAAS